MQPEYQEILQRIAAACEGCGISNGSSGKLPVRIQRSGFQADEHSGVLAVPVYASVDEIRNYIQVKVHTRGKSHSLCLLAHNDMLGQSCMHWTT